MSRWKRLVNFCVAIRQVLVPGLNARAESLGVDVGSSTSAQADTLGMAVSQ